jgi:hypothetical protein
MIKLLIEDVEVDVLQTERIVGEYAIAPIGNISKRVGARSISFKLPKTAKNRAVFESSEQPTSLSIKPYRRLKARLYVDGVDMQMLFFTLEKVKDFYEGRVYGSNADLFAILKELDMSDLDYSEFDGYYNAVDVAGTFTNNDGIIFPIVDFNSDSPNSNISNANKQMLIDSMLPAAFQNELIEKIFQQQGFTLQNSLLDIDTYADNPVLEPLLGSNERDLNGDRYLGVFNPDTDYAIVTFLNAYNTLASQVKTYWSASVPTTYDLGTFYFADKVKIGYTITSVIDTTGFPGTATFRIRVQTANGFVNDVTITPPTNAVTTYTTTDFIEIFEDGAAPEIYIEYRAFGVPFVLKAISSFEITSAEILEPYVFKLYSPATGYGGYRFLTPNSMLPKLKQSDYLKDYLLSYGAIVSLNYKSNTASIIPFKKVKDNISNAVDWSGKLDFIENNTTEFRLDYERNNIFKYEDDESVVKPDGTDYTFVIDDENLNDEAVLVELKHLATESVVRLQGREVPQIKCFTASNYETVTKPRVLIMNKGTEINFFIQQLTPNIAIGVNTNIPFCRFIDVTEDYNLGFDNSLFSNYYSFLEGILDRTKVIECLLRLNTSDIATFDFLKPVYISELDGYFYVSKIKFDYTSNASSVCELVKLL